ncbi:MAG: prolipoprotein diacylglyceryl transferase, partial [Saprospiraceae bacterium]|nr:prolipoprotein diacylglyceryl transferase [Saprospiraceae bacterium]
WTAGDWIHALNGQGLPEVPGKTIVGGLVLMVIVYALLQRWWRLPDHLADILIIGLPLAAAVGRIGCLAAGCCYGVPTHSNWGIAYGTATPAFLNGLEQGICNADMQATSLLVPVQGLFMAGNLLIFSILWYVRNRMPRPGMLALLGFGLMFIQRFGWEFLRDSATIPGMFGHVWSGLMAGQWIALLVAVFACGTWLFYYFTPLKAGFGSTTAAIGFKPARILAGIALGSLLLCDLMTFEEIFFIVVSSMPLALLLIHPYWRACRTGRKRWVPATMLSAVAILWVSQPMPGWLTPAKGLTDSLPADPALPVILPANNGGKWEQWLDVNIGGSSGRYTKTIRDCGGNAIRTETIHTRAAGLGVASNWQNGWDKFQISLRGAIGEANTDDNNFFDDNYSYSSYGIQGAYSGKIVGFGLGIASLRRVYPADVDFQGTKPTNFLVTGHVRLGRPDKFYTEIRIYDEPSFGLAYVPSISLGAGVGFGNQTDKNFMRGGFSYVGNEWRPYIGGGIKWGNTGISSNLNLLIGEHYSIFSAGIAYKIPKRNGR